MHYLNEVIKVVDHSHPHLGNLVAISMLAIKSKKLLLIVSPAGCGKSRVTSFVGLSCPDTELHDRLSVAGLASIKERLNGFQGAIVVDDIAKTQTAYARTTTLTTLAELVYSHYCISHLSGTNFEIRDFYGAALINIQPVLLREVIRSAEWEASMMDKSIRYYHLFRPEKPNPFPPSIKLDWGFSVKNVKRPKLEGKLANDLRDIGEVQWGLARLQEHTTDLLMSAAALDKRNEVTQSDYKLLIKLLQPLRVESIVTDKTELEAKRYLSSNKLAILTEFVSYGNFTLRQIARDYRLSQSQAYRIMEKYAQDWKVVAKNPTTYSPSDDLMKQLKEIGIK